MRTKYEVDMNDLNSFELGEIIDMIECAKEGKKLVPAHTKGKHYLRNSNGEIRACDFLGCAFVGKYGLEAAKYNHDPFSWQVLLYSGPLNSTEKPNSFGDYIRILSDRSGFDAVIDYLNDIVLEYDEREKETKSALEQLVKIKNTFFPKESENLNVKSYLDEKQEKLLKELMKDYWLVTKRTIYNEDE